jgi:cyclophilin family peptidyl-prolyl cis-trans isomerase
MSALKSILLGVVLLAIVIGGALWARDRNLTGSGDPNSSATPQASVSVEPAPVSSTSTTNNMHAITLKTNVGDITFQTFDADAPKAVSNFIELASKGFYDNVIFHRVIEGFMIQGGDPTGTGSGGPGYQFADELTPGTEAAKRGYVRGTVAMANAGPNTNGSQFFIMHQDYPLPYNYTIFGYVTAGQDIVDKIATTKTDSNDRPLTDVVIKSVTVKPASQ